MRLTTDHLKTGWLHPHRVVRNVVAAHFAGILTTDPDVTAHAIRGAREFGWQRFLTWDHQFTSLPLADDEAFEWVCGEAERAGEEAPAGDLAWHLTRMLARAEIKLVERHRARILALPPLRPEERQLLLARLELATCAPAEAWRRLEDHCRMAAAGETFEDARIPEAELLLEPLVRAGSASVARVMDVLSKSPQDGEGDDPADWLTGLMMILAGRLRIEEAAPRIWDLMAVDWDWYYDAAEAALTRIGTPAVTRLMGERYPQAEWEDRLPATIILARIRCDEAAAAIEAALRDEDDDGLRAELGVAAAAQFDDRLVPLALEVLSEDPEDPERGEIRELLVAFSHLSGHDLPERDAWERDADEARDHMRRRIDRITGSLANRHGEPFGDDGFDDDELDLGDLDDDDAEDEGVAGGRLQRGSQVGRNEPCPCGSGKKYKRCCLRDAAG